MLFWGQDSLTILKSSEVEGLSVASATVTLEIQTEACKKVFVNSLEIENPIICQGKKIAQMAFRSYFRSPHTERLSLLYTRHTFSTSGLVEDSWVPACASASVL